MPHDVSVRASAMSMRNQRPARWNRRVSRTRVVMALSGYDHTRDLVSGRVPVEGVELVALELPVEEIFHRFAHDREWDVSEFSLAKYVALVSAGESDLTAIPVFPSRLFRQSSVYVRADSGLRDPAELAGCRIGVPEWAQTAAVYTRAWLTHDVGVPLTHVRWFQAGVNQPGRIEKVSLRLPSGVSLTPVPDRSLTQMLLASDLDAVASAHPPGPFEAGTGEIVPLLRDARLAEEEYFRRHRVFPIMHVVAVRRHVLDRDPWVAGNLLDAFESAKRRSEASLRELTASRYPVPWLADHLQTVTQIFGGDPFPYGVAANRATLAAFVRWAAEQGVAQREVTVDELFWPSTLGTYRI